MTPEQKFFIKILADHVAGKKTETPEGLDWNAISRLSKAHQVEGIVMKQCGDDIPDDYRERFNQAQGTTLFYYTNRRADMKEVAEALKRENIPFFVVKGFEVAQFYPYPALRTMSDCDIVIENNYKRKAIEILKGMGFQSSIPPTAQQWACKRNGIGFELHDALVQHGEFTNSAQEHFFNSFAQYVTNGSLDWSFHFLFLLMHLRKHFLNYGVGFRQFMDLAVLIQNGPDLDWIWMEEKLQELKLAKYAHACYSLIERWFAVSAPISFHRMPYTEQEIMTDQIFKGGVFGFDEEENHNNAARTALVKSRGPIWLKRCMALIRTVFPRYELMRGYPGCGYIDNRRYLLPVSWIHRFWILLRTGDFNRVFKVIRNSFIRKEELEERKKTIKIMGLGE